MHALLGKGRCGMVDVARAAYFDGHELYGQGSSPRAHDRHGLSLNEGGLMEDTHSGDSRHRIAKHLEHLHIEHLVAQRRDASEVATGPPEARDEPPLDRIRTNDEHHGNGGGRLLGRRDHTGSDRDNDVDLRSDEISRKGGKAFALALGVPLFRGHVFVLDPAEGAQSLAKGRNIGWDSCQRKPSDPDPAGVLRLSGERRSEETAAQCSKERSTVH